MGLYLSVFSFWALCLWSTFILRGTPTPSIPQYWALLLKEVVLKICKKLPVELFSGVAHVFWASLWGLLSSYFDFAIGWNKGERNLKLVAQHQEDTAILIKRIWRRESQKLTYAPSRPFSISLQKLLYYLGMQGQPELSLQHFQERGDSYFMAWDESWGDREMWFLFQTSKEKMGAITYDRHRQRRSVRTDSLAYLLE